MLILCLKTEATKKATKKQPTKRQHRCRFVGCFWPITDLQGAHKNAFKLQFPIGEFDMVIANLNDVTCEIYEIKHTNQIYEAQYKHLIDREKIAQAAGSPKPKKKKSSENKKGK